MEGDVTVLEAQVAALGDEVAICCGLKLFGQFKGRLIELREKSSLTEK